MTCCKDIVKNLVHTVASLSIVVWMTGYLVYNTGGSFHYFLLTAIVAAIARVFMEKNSRQQRSEKT